MKSSKLQRWLAGSSVIMLLAVGLWQQAESQQRSPGQKREKPPVQVKAVHPQKTTIQEVRKLTGSADAVSRFTIATRTSGRLVWLRPQVGTYVRNGQEVARMEDTAFQQQIRQLESDVSVLKAQKQEVQVNLSLAEQELDRDATLFSKDLLSASELDRSRANLESQRMRQTVLDAQLQQKQQAIQQARITLTETRIFSQWPGQGARVVSRRLTDPGAIVSANTPLLELISLDPIKVVVPVTEQDFGRLKPGQSVSLHNDAYPEQVFMGSVATIPPTLNPETRTADVEILVKNPKHLLKPGMFLTADIVLATHAQAQTVPREALLEQLDESTGLFVLSPDQKTVSYLTVKTGIIDNQQVEIISPQLSGLVVTEGNHLLKDGAKIQLQSNAPAGNKKRKASPTPKTDKPPPASPSVQNSPEKRSPSGKVSSSGR